MKFSSVTLVSVFLVSAVFAAPLPQDPTATAPSTDATVAQADAPSSVKDWADYNKNAASGAGAAVKDGLHQSAQGAKQAVQGAGQAVANSGAAVVGAVANSGKAIVGAVSTAGETAAAVVIGGAMTAADKVSETAGKGKVWVVEHGKPKRWLISLF